MAGTFRPHENMEPPAGVPQQAFQQEWSEEPRGPREENIRDRCQGHRRDAGGGSGLGPDRFQLGVSPHPQARPGCGFIPNLPQFAADRIERLDAAIFKLIE